MADDVGKRLFDFKSLFQVGGDKKKTAARIAKELIAKHAGIGGEPEEKVTTALIRLVSSGILDVPGGEPDDKAVKEDLATLAENAIKAALFVSGQPALMGTAGLSVAGIRWLLDKFDRCGGTDKGNPPDGPVIKQDDQQRHIIRYYLEEDANTNPILPPIEGSTTLAASILKTAFTGWELYFKIDIEQTENLDDANLIVTGRVFGPEVDPAIVALTDIGPPGGLSGGKPVQLRMVFDLGETYNNRAEFEAAAAHEMGHVLGVRHRDISNPVNQLMNDTLNGVTVPHLHDVEAAAKKGWIRKI